ncbi:MAG: HDOD domain-containing protein [Methylococcales bacterium]|nr:HDOD domain-containing protein [Methylococcales bacterium]
MKALVKKIFTSKKADELQDSSATVLETDSQNEVLKITKPMAKSHSKLPLTILKKLAPIRDLPDEELQLIEQEVSIYAPESILFILGEKSDKMYYLLKGRIKLTSDGADSYYIDGNTALSNLPINSGKMYGATAITQTECTVLSVSPSVLHWWINESKVKTNNDPIDLLDFSLPKEVPVTQFFQNLSLACRENKLSLPTLPQVAIQLRKAMSEDIGIDEAVKIIQLDVIVVTRLIQLANSALYASLKPVTNCHDAVARLGLKATNQLVMSISVKQLFQSKSPEFILKMKYLWQKSVHVSSLSFVLAQESGVVSPEDALLAGLICDIGAIPLLNFAEKNHEDAPSLDELQNAMPYLNPEMGAFVLQQLKFSDELSEIPKHGENWFYESGQEELTLTDIVILAKFHSYLGTEQAKNLPYINAIPAYTKLKNKKLSPDFSLDVVSKAQQRIRSAMEVFA